MTTDRKRSVSRADAIRRSCKVFDRALRQFRAIPSVPARQVVELSMEAVQLADVLSQDPCHNQGDKFRRWEDAWMAAHLALYRITKHLWDN